MANIDPVAQDLLIRIVRLNTQEFTFSDDFHAWVKEYFLPYAGSVYNVVRKRCDMFLRDVDSLITMNEPLALTPPVVIGASYSPSPIEGDTKVHVYLLRRRKEDCDGMPSSTVYTLDAIVFPVDCSRHKRETLYLDIPFNTWFEEGTQARATLDAFFGTEVKRGGLPFTLPDQNDILGALKSIDDAYECRLHVISKPSPFTDANTWTQMDATADTEKLEALKDYRQQVHDLIEKYITD